MRCCRKTSADPGSARRRFFERCPNGFLTTSRCLLGLFWAAWLLPAQLTPTINPGGLVNGATGMSSSSVPVAARGEVLVLYGSNFSTGTQTAGFLPLPNQLAGTQVFTAVSPAPLSYCLSRADQSCRSPFEIPDVSVVALVIPAAPSWAAPLLITLLAQDPGIYSVTDMSGRPISPSNPVIAGQAFNILATGLGQIAPPVASGYPGLATPVSVVAIIPTVTIGQQVGTVTFAGFTPGSLNYEVTAVAPTNLFAPSSDVRLTSGVLPSVV